MPKGEDMILEIQEREGRLFIDIITELEEQGYRPSDIAAIFGMHVSTIYRYKNKIKKLDSPEQYGKRETKKYKRLNIDEIEKQFGMSFKELLVYLRRKKEMTCEQIADLLGTTESTIQYHMRKLGVQMDKSEARKQTLKTKRVDMKKVNEKVRKGFTRIYLKGSSKEERVRLLLKEKLERFLKDEYEFVIGFTDWSILQNEGKQVDIPIVIIHRQTQQFFKIAIEYDGSKFHEEEFNEEKKRLLQQKGWIYFNIYDKDLSNEELNDEVTRLLLFGILPQIGWW
jgi:DNA-binding CsgD family transcriptional regulator